MAEPAGSAEPASSAGPPLVRGEFDRDAATRLSESALEEAWRDPRTLVLRVHEGQLPIRARAATGPGDPGDQRHAAQQRNPQQPTEQPTDPPHAIELDLVPVIGQRSAEHYYLGRCGGDAVFAMLARDGDGYDAPPLGWRAPFLLGDDLTPLQLEMMTVALALVNWHFTMPFSPRDGQPTVPAHGGWARLDAHGGEHFPRNDPAVIVIVEHENRLLLGSNVLWETGRFSLLAGFVEAGESAEQAVVREIEEEAGVRVDQVTYVGSQPWPFPRSLMLGFRARLAPGVDPASLSPDPTEISELRWFTRDELREPQPDVLLPMNLSIARWLIDLWVQEGDSDR